MNLRTAARIAHIISVLTIVTLVIIRITVLFATQLWFDVDPTLDYESLPAMNMAESFWIDVLMLLASSVVLLIEGTLGRGLDVKLWLLAALPVPIVLWHGGADAVDMWRGMMWVSAACSAVALAHAARAIMWRSILIAILLAALLPPMARGVLQVTTEHQATVQQFEANKETYFQGRGWAPDSPMALIYERRLRQAQPRGWFGSTNVLASLLAFALIACIGMARVADAAKRSSGEAGLVVLFALAAGGLLFMTGSKGAWLAAAFGLIILFLPSIGGERFKSLARRRAGSIGLALVVLTLLGVAVRGVLLPEGFLGEKSLLFRWHYLQGTAAIIADAPVTGVGPGGFQAAYMLHRPPRNPEEVQSAHNFIADWWAMLGALGLAWTSLVLILLRRAAATDDQSDEPDPSEPPAFPTTWRWIMVAAALVGALTTSLIIDMRAPQPLDGIIVRQLAMLIAIGVAGLLVPLIAAGWTIGVRWALMAACLALVVHGLIEMTFFSFGGAAWSLAMLGIVGGASTTGVRRWRAVVMAAVIAGVAVFIAFTAARPAGIQAEFIADAACVLRPAVSIVESTENGTTIKREVATPQEPGALLESRREAAKLLQSAYSAWPTNVVPLDSAAHQLRSAKAPPEGATPLALLFEAATIASFAVTQNDRSSSMMLLAQISMQLGAATGDEIYFQQAAMLFRRLYERDPHGVQAAVLLGDLLLRLGDRDAAHAMYRIALDNNANLALDELKQLPGPVEARISHELRQERGQ